MTDTNDPLKVLGLGPDSSLADVRERYRFLCLKYHPDKNPGTEHIFRAIAEAYAKIKANPDILCKREVGGLVSYLNTYVVLTIKDFYFAEEKSIELSRHSLCSSCSGTGAKEGKSAVCSCCNGQGIIESSVLSLLGRDSLCPVCKGSGIVGDACPKCGGEKRVLEKVVAKYRATLHVFYHKHVLLKGMGNARPDGSYEDLMVKVRIHKDPYVAIDGKNFVVYVNSSPAQRASGDTGVITLFGRKIPYIIKQDSSSYLYRDRIRGTFYRDVVIHFREYFPKLTLETEDLYKQIKEQEKKSCAEIGQMTCYSLTTNLEENTVQKTL